MHTYVRIRERTRKRTLSYRRLQVSNQVASSRFGLYAVGCTNFPEHSDKSMLLSAIKNCRTLIHAHRIQLFFDVCIVLDAFDAITWRSISREGRSCSSTLKLRAMHTSSVILLQLAAYSRRPARQFRVLTMTVLVCTYVHACSRNRNSHYRMLFTRGQVWLLSTTFNLIHIYDKSVSYFVQVSW